MTLVNHIAFEAVTKHCQNENCDKNVIRWIQNDLTEIEYSYEYLETESNQIANVLKNLGIKAKDVVSIFLPRSPILFTSFFGILKLQAISCILFSSLGAEALID